MPTWRTCWVWTNGRDVMAMTAADNRHGLDPLYWAARATSIAAELAVDEFDVAVAMPAMWTWLTRPSGQISGHGRRGAAFAVDIVDERASWWFMIDGAASAASTRSCTAGINHPVALDRPDLVVRLIDGVNVRGTFVVNEQAARRFHDGWRHRQPAHRAWPVRESCG